MLTKCKKKKKKEERKEKKNYQKSTKDRLTHYISFA